MYLSSWLSNQNKPIQSADSPRQLLRQVLQLSATLHQRLLSAASRRQHRSMADPKPAREPHLQQARFLSRQAGRRRRTLTTQVGEQCQARKKQRCANSRCIREKKLPEPRAPNTVPDAPAPNAAPASAPLPRCNSTKAMIDSAINVCLLVQLSELCPLLFPITRLVPGSRVLRSPGSLVPSVTRRRSARHQYPPLPAILAHSRPSCCRRTKSVLLRQPRICFCQPCREYERCTSCACSGVAVITGADSPNRLIGNHSLANASPTCASSKPRPAARQ